MIVSEPRIQDGFQSNAFLQRLVRASHAKHGTQAYLNLIRQSVCCDLLTVYRARDHHSPTCLLSEGTGSKSVFDSAATAYSQRHYRTDTVLQQVLPSARTTTDALQVRVTAADAADSAFRRDCYTAPGIKERIGIYFRIDDGWVWLNVYRIQRGEAFNADHQDAIARIAPNVLAAIHSPHDAKTLDLASLSLNERKVLQCSLEGLTAKEIARQQGIAATTVNTYRQRVYRKLGVGSQREIVSRLANLVDR